MTHAMTDAQKFARETSSRVCESNIVITQFDRASTLNLLSLKVTGFQVIQWDKGHRVWSDNNRDICGKVQWHGIAYSRSWILGVCGTLSTGFHLRPMLPPATRSTGLPVGSEKKPQACSYLFGQQKYLVYFPTLG